MIRPLSERLAEIMRLPIPGGSADTLAEAVELARRVEAARIVTLYPKGDGLCVELPPVETVGSVTHYRRVSWKTGGKRVALVEVPGG